VLTWRQAWETAQYGPGGFWARGEEPGRHFRTSVHASPLFAGAVLTLLERVDAALGHPPVLDLVDVGAGRGELLTAVGALAPAGLRDRLRPTAVEIRPGIDAVRDVRDLPPVTGLLVANEWLDDVPLDVVVRTPAGPRLALVDPAGVESPGPPPAPEDLAWIDRWWPARPAPDSDPDPYARADPENRRGADPGTRSGAAPPGHADPGAGAGPGAGDAILERIEVGRSRDDAWAAAVSRIARGVALAIDYGHEAPDRPPSGTLTGYRGGAQVPPVPDGTRNLTAHVALDSVAAAGRRAGAGDTRLDDQRSALLSLGVDPQRPPVSLATTDPPRYAAALRRAAEAAELTDRTGLGSFSWLVQGVGIRVPAPPVATRARVRRAPAPPPPGHDGMSGSGWATRPDPDTGRGH
jgi:SAM-dependent MidA family methyltransferase